MVTLTINGRQVKVSKGTTILQAAAGVGVRIPHLCHHDGLHPYGACRICTVEVVQGGRTHLQASCTYPVADGIEVRTTSERADNGRRMILELLLARCPESETVRALAAEHGVEKTRFKSRGEVDCVLCGLCVRACREVVGAEVLGFSGRGASRRVEIPPHGHYPERCIGCGLCTYVCPTGHVQMELRAAAGLRQEVGTERTCRYMLMGLVSQKTCPQNFECWHCPYDQFVELALGGHAALRIRPAERRDSVAVGPFLCRRDRAYAPNHTWARRLGGAYVIGVDEVIAAALSPVTAVAVDAGGLTLSTGDRRLRLALPVIGTLLKVNPAIDAVPRLVGFSPYERGWVAVVRADEAPDLLGGLAAERWLRAEVDRLEELTGLAGEALAPAALAEHWERLEKEFFQDVLPAKGSRRRSMTTDRG